MKRTSPSRNSNNNNSNKDEIHIMSDEDILQEALAESQRRMESQQQRAPSDCNTLEVLYNNGATPLFNAIEETKWSEALDLLQVVPEQAMTWVASTGTENTTFGWSLWRRLPIHEACRRQAPAWLIAALLKAAPLSIRETTQFGELPLHLAVEMGASPEVINLLLVNFYPGIHAPDNSGRTPMQIHLQGEGVLCHVDDHSYIQDSLTNADTTLVQMEAHWKSKLDDLAAQHEAQKKEMQATHLQALTWEKETIRNLQKDLARVEGHVEKYKEERNALEKTLSSHHVEKGTWRETLESKIETVEALVQKLEYKDAELSKLKQEMQNKSKQCSSLVERVETLEEDLRNIVLLQQDQVTSSMQQLDRDFQRLIQSHAVLGGKLHGQSQGLNLLLQARGISLPPPPPPPSPPPSQVSQVPVQFEDTGMEEVSAAAAQAAKMAIMKAEVEVYEKDVLTELEDEILQQESTLTHRVSAEEKKDPDIF